MVRRRIAFFVPHMGCGRKCVYCDQNAITGVTGGHITPDAVADVASAQKSPAEFCFFGGSFARIGTPRMKAFMDAVCRAPEGSAVTFSSYPGDFDGNAGLDAIRFLKDYPIATIELGIPTLDPLVLKTCRRDDDPAAITRTVARIRDNGFHLGVQMMIGLPRQTADSVSRDAKTLALMMPAGVAWHFRLYPCLVLRGTELEKMYRRGEYAPLSLEEGIRTGGAVTLEAERLGFNVIRIGLPESDSLKKSTAAGPYHPAFGELAMSEKRALSLISENPDGPWIIERRTLSQFTGHAGRGIRRLAEMSGISEREARNRLVVLPPAGA
jgi:histone acetyltransferase (RNA polymerase elongator complex component)